MQTTTVCIACSRGVDLNVGLDENNMIYLNASWLKWKNFDNDLGGHVSYNLFESEEMRLHWQDKWSIYLVAAVVIFMAHSFCTRSDPHTLFINIA